MRRWRARKVGFWLLSRWRLLIAFIGGAGVVLLLTTVLADASLRFAFNKPIPGTLEYVSFWYMVPIAFCGMVLAERRNEHVDAPLIFDRLPVVLQREFEVVSKVLFLAVLCAMLYWGWQEALQQHAFGERGAAAGVSIWPTRFFVPIGAAACAVEVLASLISTRRPGVQPGAIV